MSSKTVEIYLKYRNISGLIKEETREGFTMAFKKGIDQKKICSVSFITFFVSFFKNDKSPRTPKLEGSFLITFFLGLLKVLSSSTSKLHEVLPITKYYKFLYDECLKDNNVIYEIAKVFKVKCPDNFYHKEHDITLFYGTYRISFYKDNVFTFWDDESCNYNFHKYINQDKYMFIIFTKESKKDSLKDKDNSSSEVNYELKDKILSLEKTLEEKEEELKETSKKLDDTTKKAEHYQTLYYNSLASAQPSYYPYQPSYYPYQPSYSPIPSFEVREPFVPKSPKPSQACSPSYFKEEKSIEPPRKRYKPSPLSGSFTGEDFIPL